MLNYKIIISENHGYIFTPSTIDASPEEKADFQRAIDFIIFSLIDNPEYILLFQEECYLEENKDSLAKSIYNRDELEAN